MKLQAPVCGVVHSGRYPLLILERAILEHVTGGAIRDNVGFADHACVLHTERCKNALLEKVAPEFAAHFVDENSERDIAEIAVAPLFARSGSERLRRRSSSVAHPQYNLAAARNFQDNRRARRCA